ncbi:MAG: S8 family serine peptidase [Candidatus Melainabacteria bacterium]
MSTIPPTGQVVIQNGDTIWGILNDSGASVSPDNINKVLAANGISDPTQLQVGQVVDFSMAGIPELATPPDGPAPPPAPGAEPAGISAAEAQAMGFNEQAYLDANPDVYKAVVVDKIIPTAFDHFRLHGLAEGRDPTGAKTNDVALIDKGKIAVLEGSANPGGPEESDQHAGAVTSIIDGSAGAINANDIEVFGGFLDNLPPINSLESAVAQNTVFLNNVSSQIEKIAADPNTDFTAINISMNASPIGTILDAIRLVESNPALQQQALATAQQRPDLAAADQQTTIRNVVTDVVRQMMRTDPNLNQAFIRYDQAVQAAAAKGITTVVAAGNNNAQLQAAQQAGIKGIDSGLGLNFLARSRNVISVANTDDKGTAATTDDTINATSSTGGVINGQAIAGPTLGADGTDVKVGTIPGTFTGTSFSAPKVTAAAFLSSLALRRTGQQADAGAVKQAILSGTQAAPQLTQEQVGAGVLLLEKLKAMLGIA